MTRLRSTARKATLTNCGLAFACDLPGLGVLPAGVSGVIEVQEESFAAVEEAEAKEVVSKEGEGWEKKDVVAEGKGRAARVPFVDDDLGAKGAVAIEALDVTFESGIGVVDDI